MTKSIAYFREEGVFQLNLTTIVGWFVVQQIEQTRFTIKYLCMSWLPYCL